jgi:hypothetical protein
LAKTAVLQHPNVKDQTVARRPQTTVPGGTAHHDFVRESRKCNQLGFAAAGNAFGATISRTIRPTPGYLRGLWIVAMGTGGTGTATVTAAADAPWNLFTNIQLRDAFGTVVYNSDGFGAYAIQLYSGQVGAAGFQNPTGDAWYSAIATGANGTGNFTFALYLPLEFDEDTGYCSLPSMNTAAQMALSIQLAASTSFYGVAPTTPPSIEVDVYEEYWAVPLTNPHLAPPHDGSSHQWSLSQASNTIASASNGRVQLPDVGTWISSIIIVARNASNVRIDTIWSSDLELWIDSVPVRIEPSNALFSRMYRQFGVTRPTGVAVYTFRDSAGKLVNIDDMELLMATTPGTLVELVSGTWGTFATGPATIQTYTGKLYPTGNVPDRVV